MIKLERLLITESLLPCCARHNEHMIQWEIDLSTNTFLGEIPLTLCGQEGKEYYSEY